MNKLLINDYNKFDQLIPVTSKLDDSMLIPQSRISQDWAFDYVPTKIQEILVDGEIANIQDLEFKKVIEKISLYVHNTIANHIMLSLLPKTYIRTTSAGVSVQNTETHERAPKWSVDQAQQAYVMDCYTFLAKLLEALESNRTILNDNNIIDIPKKNSILSLYSECQNLSLSIDIITFNQLKGAFAKQEENYIYSYVPQELCNKFLKGEIKGAVAVEFFQRSRDIILTASMYHNVFSLSVMKHNGMIASVPMAKNETTQQLTIPIAQLKELQEEWYRTLQNMQKSMGSFVLANEAVFGETPFFTENTSTGILPEYNNASGKTFFM